MYCFRSYAECIAYTYHWKIDETPEGQDSATIVKPIHVKILDEQLEILPHNASILLMEKYSVHLAPEWDRAYAHRLLETFESIPQIANHLGDAESTVSVSMWMLSDQHVQDDINLIMGLLMMIPALQALI